MEGAFMKQKTTIKYIVDVLMTLALLFLMGYQFWGEAAHEWIGAGMFLLFILHHLLNLHWHRHIFKRKYTSWRSVNLCVDVAVLLPMPALMYSGVVMSRHAFSFLPMGGGLSLARKLHILGSYWGYALMGLHLGLHWNMVLGAMKKKCHIPPSLPYSVAAKAVSTLLAVYGFTVFLRRDFITYMFLRSEFVFLDYNEPKLLFYWDYLALMGLCIFAAHYGGKLLNRRKKEDK